MFPALPSALAYHGNIMSWGTAIGSALTIFTVLATIWNHGLRAEPGIIAILMGFVLYILDGVSAIVTSNVAWSFQLHGTMWASGHTMAVLISISMIWMGVLYHHYPVITGRKLNNKLGNWFVTLYTVGAIGAMYAMLAGGGGRHAPPVCCLESGRLDDLRCVHPDFRAYHRRIPGYLCLRPAEIPRHCHDTGGTGSGDKPVIAIDKTCTQSSTRDRVLLSQRAQLSAITLKSSSNSPLCSRINVNMKRILESLVFTAC